MILAATMTFVLYSPRALLVLLSDCGFSFSNDASNAEGFSFPLVAALYALCVVAQQPCCGHVLVCGVSVLPLVPQFSVFCSMHEFFSDLLCASRNRYSLFGNAVNVYLLPDFQLKCAHSLLFDVLVRMFVAVSRAYAG